MSRIVWESGDHHLGVDRGVLYPQNSPGVGWAGLIAVSEGEDGGSTRTRYLDGVKIQSNAREGAFSGKILSMTYPDELFEFVLTQQKRRTFGLSYRTLRGDSYLIHIVYNVSTRPAPVSYTMSEADPFTWDFTTIPVDIPNGTRSAHLIVDGTKAYSWAVSALEDILYGTESDFPRLPSPQEVWDLIELNSIVRVIDNGDGSFVVIGPDEYVNFIDTTSFSISWPSALYVDVDTYMISSL